MACAGDVTSSRCFILRMAVLFCTLFAGFMCSLSEADARRSPLADSILLMMNFGIDKMSLEIQSRGEYSPQTLCY